jgi:chaperonin GroES
MNQKNYRDFTPCFDRILLKREDSALSKKTTNAGLLLPEQIKDRYKSSEGVLVKIGDECRDSVKAMLGKKVLFAKYSGEDLQLNGEDYVLATEGDIFGELNDQ